MNVIKLMINRTSKQLRRIGLMMLVGLLLTACQGDASSVNGNDDQQTEESGDGKTGTDGQDAEVKGDAENEVEAEPELTDEEILAQAIEDRNTADAKNLEEDGDFYVPLPVIETMDDVNKEAIKVKAKTLYVTGNIAGFSFDQANIDLYANYVRGIAGEIEQTITESQAEEANRLERILALCEVTEVNAVVIDVKNDDGFVKWDSDVEAVNQAGSDANAPFKDVEGLMTYLKEHDIYTIARVVAFKDPYFAERNPEHTIQLKEGGIYRDSDGIAWVNPFDPFIWDYVIALSKEAANRGFDEIQYDYVRFPDNAAKYNPITTFPGRDGRDKDEGIEAFLTYAKEELAPYKVNLAADVFAQASRSWDDQPEDIGQTWRKVANVVDYICPMVYPSHYGYGVYGMDVPDKYPYEVLNHALTESIERNSAQENPGAIRPWIQGFNASWIKGHINYDGPTIAKQIIAAREVGIEEYIIWDPSNTYEPEIFFYEDQLKPEWPLDGKDRVGRTPEEAMERFIDAERKDQTSRLYLLTPRADRVSDYDEFKANYEKEALMVSDYELIGIKPSDTDGVYEARVSVNYSSSEGEASLNNAVFTIQMEDGVFKIHKPEIKWENPEDYPLGLLPNEMGKVMVLMYHNVGDEEEEWVRTPDNMRKDLQNLYDKGYRPIALTDYVAGNITTEAGYSPVVITIDDTNPNNFVYLEDGSIDPDCLVGILMEFHEKHPDFPLEATFFADGPTAFGAKDEEKKKINAIIDAGMDIGNHTLRHESLKNMSAEEIQEAIGAQKAHLESLIDDKSYKVNTLALPYGERPSDDALDQYLLKGSYDGEAYENVVALNVGWNPAPSPYDDDFDPASTPRIRASEMKVDNVGMYDYLESFEKHPGRRFISDGKN